MQCPKKKGTHIRYNVNPAYYLSCTDTGIVEMFKCPEEIFQVYDSNSKSCVYNCNKSGTYEDRELCTNYYHCSGPTKKLKSVNVMCPAGYYFKGDGCHYGSCINAVDIMPF